MGALLPGPAEAMVFVVAVAVLNATPGVDLLLTVGRTLGGGARAGVAAALGIGAGCIVHALAAAFGLAALLVLHPRALLLVQWAGGAYLLWLGAQLLRSAWRDRGAAGAAAGATRDRPLAEHFRAGLLTNVLNPKVALFFLAFLPQFVPVSSPSPTASMLLLGGWFVLQGTVFLLLLVAVAARIGRLGASPALRRLLAAAGGGLFIALALRLLRERPLAA